jgi:hypothetical protein
MVLFFGILSTSVLELIPQCSDPGGFIRLGIGCLSLETKGRYIFVVVTGHRSLKKYTVSRITASGY